MKRAFAFVAAVLFVGSAGAHGPTPIKVIEKVTIAVEPKAVWAIIGRFDRLTAWHPDVTKVTASGGGEVGAVREITLRNGSVLKESLDEFEPEKFKYSYRMSDPNLDAMPVSSYSMTLMVKPADGGSEVEWYGRLYRGDTGNEPPENLNDDAARQAVTEFLHAGLQGLKKKAEAR